MAGFSIDHIGQLEVYLVLAVFTFAPVVMIFTRPEVLPETARMQAGADGKQGSVFDLWRIPALRNTIIAAGIVGSAQDLFQFYMPIYGHSVGLSASAIGTILGTSAAAAFVIRGILPFLSRRLTEAQILKSAIFIAAFAFSLFPLVQPGLRAWHNRIRAGAGCGLRAANDDVAALRDGTGEPARGGIRSAQDRAQRDAPRGADRVRQHRRGIRLHHGVPVELGPARDGGVPAAEAEDGGALTNLTPLLRRCGLWPRCLRAQRQRLGVSRRLHCQSVRTEARATTRSQCERCQSFVLRDGQRPPQARTVRRAPGYAVCAFDSCHRSSFSRAPFVSGSISSSCPAIFAVSSIT